MLFEVHYDNKFNTEVDLMHIFSKNYTIKSLHELITLKTQSTKQTLVVPQELEVRSLYHLYSLKTKSSRCHYVVMTLWAFGIEAIGVI